MYAIRSLTTVFLATACQNPEIYVIYEKMYNAKKSVPLRHLVEKCARLYMCVCVCTYIPYFFRIVDVILVARRTTTPPSPRSRSCTPSETVHRPCRILYVVAWHSHQIPIRCMHTYTHKHTHVYDAHMFMYRLMGIHTCTDACIPLVDGCVYWGWGLLAVDCDGGSTAAAATVLRRLNG